MAFNPTPEVAAIRDAAQKLKSPFAVIIYLSENGSQLGMASYGKNVALCKEAGRFGEWLLNEAQKWGTTASEPEHP